MLIILGCVVLSGIVQTEVVLFTWQTSYSLGNTYIITCLEFFLSK